MTALIFDLDGVVADTAAAHNRSWQRLAAEEGLSGQRQSARFRRAEGDLILDEKVLELLPESALSHSRLPRRIWELRQDFQLLAVEKPVRCWVTASSTLDFLRCPNLIVAVFA